MNLPSAKVVGVVSVVAGVLNSCADNPVPVASALAVAVVAPLTIVAIDAKSVEIWASKNALLSFKLPSS